MPIREPNMATGLYSITGVDNIKEERATASQFNIPYPIYHQNEVVKTKRHHRRKNERRRVLRDQAPFEIVRATPDEGDNPVVPDSIKESIHADGDEYGGETNHERDDGKTNDNTKESSNIQHLPNFPRRCKENSEDSNCTATYHFPSSVLMIEAHYNQTVRDFLQICTPVERVEIDSVEDVQILLNALYQQMSVNKGRTTPSSMVLLFNLEHYANWTKERVVEVLQATVGALHNDFNDMMIYSKFHQDGSDYNDTHLTLTYDVKYWLADLCNQRLIPCADFASIILESVLRMNEIENDAKNPDNTAGASDSLEDASSQANQ